MISCNQHVTAFLRPIAVFLFGLKRDVVSRSARAIIYVTMAIGIKETRVGINRQLSVDTRRDNVRKSCLKN